MIRLIVSDLDDTLIHKDDHLSDEIVDLVKDLRNRGIHFTFATGRMPYRAMNFVKDIDLKIPFVANNGSILHDGEKIVYAKLLHAPDLKDTIQKYMEKSPEFTVLFSYEDRERPLRITHWIHDRLHKYPGYNEPLGCEDSVWEQDVHKIYVVDSKLKQMIEKVRNELHEIVDREMNDLLHRLDHGGPVEQLDMVLPLSTMPAYFKGKKPLSLIYPDGTEVSVTSWKTVAYHLLNDCASDPEMRERLYRMQDKVSGRDRVLLASTGEGMDRPIEFCENLFFESKFDTETLLRVITTRIFKPVGYDYYGISLKVIDPRIQALAEQHTRNEVPGSAQEDDIGLEMTM